MDIWGKIKNFCPEENWGDHRKINGLLLLLLDKITDQVKRYTWEKYRKISPCIIHCAYQTTGHAPNSQHYKGNAADFHFSYVPCIEAYEVMLEVLQEYQVEDFVGIGVYPDWYTPGFHLDLRGYRARWSRINNIYKGINEGLKKIKGD